MTEPWHCLTDYASHPSSGESTAAAAIDAMRAGDIDVSSSAHNSCEFVRSHSLMCRQTFMDLVPSWTVGLGIGWCSNLLRL